MQFLGTYSNMRIDLINPRHPYAAPLESGQGGHVYTPHALWTAAARLKAVGHEIKLYDENLRPYDGDSEILGIGFTGAPTIPEVQKLQARIGERTAWLLGGQIFDPRFGLSDAQRIHLFGERSINGNKDAELQRILGHEENLASPEETSLISVYEEIDDADFVNYLSHEMSFYLSQGCKEKCTFCTAPKAQAERYRKPEVLEKDLEYLIKRAVNLGINSLNMYVSNLDLLQSPFDLEQWVQIILRMQKKYPGFTLNWRALSTTTSFNTEEASALLPRLKESGLKSVGFGIDGAREDVWKSTAKRQNLQDCLSAIASCREAGITPEALMVFGHPKETPEALVEAVRLTFQFNAEYGAIPRPHVAKSVYPGNAAWRVRDNAGLVDSLMRTSLSFQALDFTARASSISHPDPSTRAYVNHCFETICDIPGNITQAIYPLAPEFQPLWNIYRRINQGKFDI